MPSREAKSLKTEKGFLHREHRSKKGRSRNVNRLDGIDKKKKLERERKKEDDRRIKRYSNN